MKWTEQDIEDLRLGVSIGLDRKEIAQILGRTYSAVRAKIHVVQNPKGVAESMKKWWKANQKYKTSYNEEYYERNRDKILTRQKEYYTTNKDAIRAKQNEYHKRYYQENKERIAIYKAEYHQNNKGLRRGYSAAYRARKLNATPSWSEAEAIREFYLNKPVGFEVDHIIPIKGVNICGLHVISNLQYLTIEDNRRKGNKYD